MVESLHPLAHPAVATTCSSTLFIELTEWRCTLHLDGDLLLLIIPLSLYLMPALICKRIFFSSTRASISKWSVLGVPLAAWISSVVIRICREVFMGMGNFIYEPLWLVLAPIVFWFMVNRFERTPQSSSASKSANLKLLFGISVVAPAIFMLFPAIGDWP